MAQITNKTRAAALFSRASELEERAEFRRAFKLMLAAAKLGDSGAQVNVGIFYDEGRGVRKNQQLALYWFRRACRRGESAAAYNIAICLRNEKKYDRALGWFQRARKLGDKEADLEIAKHYLRLNDYRRATKLLERVSRAHAENAWSVTAAGAEEASRLLRECKKKRRAQ